ncbi:hypothetical protein LPJ72_005586, partial [Coemansia sp. Benny D160-2]
MSPTISGTTPSGASSSNSYSKPSNRQYNYPEVNSSNNNNNNNLAPNTNDMVVPQQYMSLPLPPPPPAGPAPVGGGPMVIPSAAAPLPPQPPLQQQPPVAGFVAPVVKKRTPPAHLGLHNAVGTAAMPHPPPAHYQMQHQLLSPYPYSAPIAGVFPPALTGPIPAGPGDTITTTAPMSPAGFWVQSPAQNIAPMP